MASRTEILAELARAPDDDANVLYRAAVAADAHGCHEAVRARLVPLVAGRHKAHAGLWQMLGLAHRGLGDSAQAARAFARACELRPDDPLLTHSVARTTLEGGGEAVALFDHAVALAPVDGSVRLGRAAAQLAAGEGCQAREDLAELLAKAPGWLEGHAAYANLTAISAPDENPMATIDAALQAYPGEPALTRQAIAMSMHARDFVRARDLAAGALAAVPGDVALRRLQAACTAELGQGDVAQEMFARLPPATDALDVAWEARNLLRLGRHDQCAALLDGRFSGDLRTLWAYRALAWRLTGDPRWEWLEGDERLIGTYDIAGELGDMTELAECLRGLHRRSGQHIDQSVRGGSQTDGNLLIRNEEPIRRLRQALLAAVSEHVAQLPAPVSGHPTLIARREPLRIAGAWSVRLVDEGFHVDHIHPQGWFSSAFYVALPRETGESGGHDGRAGWLAFGENRELAPDLEPFRWVEPKVGTLALFPSVTWHGTRRFGSGERMTVAFDIALPQDNDRT